MRINQLIKLGVQVIESDNILGGEKIFTYNNKQLIVYKNYGHYCIGRYKDGFISPLLLWSYNTLSEVYYAIIYLFDIDYSLNEIIKNICIFNKTVFHVNSKLPEKVILDENNLANYDSNIVLNKTFDVIREWLNLGWDKCVNSFNYKIEYVDNRRFIVVSNIQWLYN